MSYEPPRPASPSAGRGGSRRNRSSPHGSPSRAGRPRRAADVYRRRRRSLLCLYVSLAAVCLSALLTSPALSVKQERILGVQALSPEERQATIEATLVPPNTNWFRAPTATLEQRVRRLPWVNGARVEHAFPNGIRARVTLRRPVVLVRTAGGLFETDAAGVAIRLAGPETVLPLIELQSPRAVRAGTAFNDDAIDAAIRIAETTRQDNLVRIAKIEVDLSDNLCLNMQDGLPIQIGQVEDLPAKLALVRRIYEREPDVAQRVSAINLTCPSWPACTPRIASTSPTNAPSVPKALTVLQ